MGGGRVGRLQQPVWAGAAAAPGGLRRGPGGQAGTHAPRGALRQVGGGSVFWSRAICLIICHSHFIHTIFILLKTAP